VATSRGRRLVQYLYSNKNLAGCAAGLAGLGLYFTGVVDELWPVVVGGLYGVGALATPPTRSIDLRSGLDPAHLNRALAEQERRLRGRAPDDVLAAVGRIHARVREVLERRAALPPGSPDAFAVERTAVDYLPTALETYLNLPRVYANRVPLSDGRTARQVLLAQLALLELELDGILEAMARGDADRLLAHGRFLEDRFARPELDIGEPGGG
jgi:hypothetical protein